MKIFEINISDYSFEELLKILSDKLTRHEKFIFAYINVFILQIIKKDATFREILNSFDNLYCDGVGVYLASKILYGKKGLKNRITGTDLYFKILELSDLNNYKCMFLSVNKDALGLIKDSLHSRYPGIQVTGTILYDKNFSFSTIEDINKSGSDILFVGLGTPLQEQWMSQYRNKINIPIQLTTGSGIEFMSGFKRRAPKFYQKIGFEWLYRLFHEPKRLWKRYLLGIPIFIYQILLFKLKLIVKAKN